MNFEFRGKKWWEEFWQDPSRNYGPANKKLLEYTKKFRGSRQNLQAVDIASGDGRYAMPLTKQGYKVSALDLSENSILRTKDAANKDNLDIDARQGDFVKLANEKKYFDLVVSSGLLEEVLPEYHRAVVNGYMNWTKSNGLNVIKYCLEIKNRGQLVHENLIPTLYKEAGWKLLFQEEEEEKLRRSKGKNKINNRNIDSFIRTGTVIAVKPTNS